MYTVFCYQLGRLGVCVYIYFCEYCYRNLEYGGPKIYFLWFCSNDSFKLETLKTKYIVGRQCFRIFIVDEWNKLPDEVLRLYRFPVQWLVNNFCLIIYCKWVISFWRNLPSSLQASFLILMMCPLRLEVWCSIQSCQWKFSARFGT